MNSGWTSSDRVRLYRRDSKFGIPYGWAGYWNIGRNVEYATNTWSALPPLYYVWNRHYHTQLGRWLTPDPIGSWGDPSQRGNPYQYCSSMPSVAADPTGFYMRIKGRAPGDWNSGDYETAKRWRSQLQDLIGKRLLHHYRAAYEATLKTVLKAIDAYEGMHTPYNGGWSLDKALERAGHGLVGAADGAVNGVTGGLAGKGYSAASGNNDGSFRLFGDLLGISETAAYKAGSVCGEITGSVAAGVATGGTSGALQTGLRIVTYSGDIAELIDATREGAESGDYTRLLIFVGGQAGGEALQALQGCRLPHTLPGDVRVPHPLSDVTDGLLTRERALEHLSDRNLFRELNDAHRATTGRGTGQMRATVEVLPDGRLRIVRWDSDGVTDMHRSGSNTSGTSIYDDLPFFNGLGLRRSGDTWRGGTHYD